MTAMDSNVRVCDFVFLCDATTILAAFQSCTITTPRIPSNTHFDVMWLPGALLKPVTHSSLHERLCAHLSISCSCGA